MGMKKRLRNYLNNSTMEDKKKAEDILQKTLDETLGNDRYVVDGRSVIYIRKDIVLDAIAKSSEALPSDEEIREWAKDVEIEGRDEEKMSGFDYMVFAAKTMRDMIRNRLQGGK
jgi:hypothetical protein